MFWDSVPKVHSVFIRSICNICSRVFSWVPLPGLGEGSGLARASYWGCLVPAQFCLDTTPNLHAWGSRNSSLGSLFPLKAGMAASWNADPADQVASTMWSLSLCSWQWGVRGDIPGCAWWPPFSVTCDGLKSASFCFNHSQTKDPTPDFFFLFLKKCLVLHVFFGITWFDISEEFFEPSQSSGFVGVPLTWITRTYQEASCPELLDEAPSP